MTSHEASESTSFSAFKKAQIRHRRQGKNPNRDDDLGQVIDFSRNQDDRILSLKLPKEFEDSCIDIYRGPIYGLTGFPGFLFAPQALTESLQLEIAFQAVSSYCEAPNKTNIDQCPPKPTEECNHEENMWELWKKSNVIPPETPKKQKLETHSRKKKYRSFKKLSWATMGYHYDWTERCYKKEFKSSIPSMIGKLSQLFAKASLVLEEKSSSSHGFYPEASIVNYYNLKSLMGGHRDELELALDKPVVSMSTGLSAVFLLGGKTKDDEPVLPILVRKGDVMCLGGDCRLNYHGMARLLPGSMMIPNVDPTICPTTEQRASLETLSMDTNEISNEDRIALEEYLSQHRLNITVRQVYPTSNNGDDIEN